MVSLALYRGNLHRVSDAPREWQMPPRAITLSQFRILTQKREKALARLAAAQKNPKKEEEEVKVKEEEEEEVEVKNPEVPQPQLIEVKVESKEAEDRKETIEASIPASSSAAKGSETATATTTTQVRNFVTFSDSGIRAIYRNRMFLRVVLVNFFGGSERLGLITGMFGKFYYFKAILHFMLDGSGRIRACIELEVVDGRFLDGTG